MVNRWRGSNTDRRFPYGSTAVLPTVGGLVGDIEVIKDYCINMD